MRALLSAVVVLSLGCGEGGAVPVVEGATPPCETAGPSAWARLKKAPITFQLHPGTSLGSLTTRRIIDLRPPLPVELRLASGRVQLLSNWDASGQLLSLTRFEGTLGNVYLSELQLPPAGLTLTNVSFKLARSVALPVRWLGNGAVGAATGRVPIEIRASILTSTGEASPLDVGHLDGVPLELLVQQSAGDVLLVSVKAAQPGVLWSWGGLFELGNLAVVMDASEEGALIELPTTATAP